MDGYGIQDMFICPKRGAWMEDDTLYGDYGMIQPYGNGILRI